MLARLVLDGVYACTVLVPPLLLQSNAGLVAFTSLYLSVFLYSHPVSFLTPFTSSNFSLSVCVVMGHISSAYPLVDSSLHFTSTTD